MPSRAGQWAHDKPSRFLTGLGHVLLDAFLVEATNEPFNDAILPRRVGVINSCYSRYSRQPCWNLRLRKISPLSLRKTGASRIAEDRRWFQVQVSGCFGFTIQ